MDITQRITKPLHVINSAAEYAHSSPLNSTLHELALTDALLLHASESGESTLHLWESTRPTVLLGMMDTKLPRFQEACRALLNQSYDVLVRQSGGLAVPSDPGILNFSLILKNPLDQRLTIEEGYQLALALLEHTLVSEQGRLVAGEVPQSYCPGSYDVSIQHKKIMGLSQRRVKEGLGIMGYLGVHGDQTARSQLIQHFYTTGDAYQNGSTRYPVIQPSVMGTLHSTGSADVTVSDIRASFHEGLASAGLETINHTYSPHVQLLYNEAVEKLVKRNEKMMKSLFRKEVFQ